MPDLRAEIANFAVIGVHRSTLHLAQNKTWARNHISLKLSGRAVDLYQLAPVFDHTRKLRGAWVHTTTLYVRNVKPDERSSAERLVVDLCHLLSFATMSQVRPFTFHMGSHGRRWNGEGEVSQWRPPIEPDGEAIANFVEQTWRAYRKLKRSRKLPELIHYLTLADTGGQPLEVRMLLSFVALENMKATWAKQRRYPYRRGQFLKAVKSKGRPKTVPWKFEELLAKMFAETRMRPALRRIVRVRNQIVHFGLTNNTVKSNVEYYERTKALQHEYLLRILEYKGPFFDYSTRIERKLS